MRNANTDNIAVDINNQWKLAKVGIDKLKKSHISAFMHSFDAHDITEPYIVNSIRGKDAYAAFHIVRNGLYVTVYYWHSSGEWFVKV